MDQVTHLENDDELILFISHSSENTDYCQALEHFLISLRFKQENIKYSSVPSRDPSEGEEFYEWFRSQFGRNLHVIYMLSDAYFQSVPCVLEMGAAWVTQKDYTSFILPGLSMSDAQRPINPDKMGIDLNMNDLEIIEQLKQFAQIINVNVSDFQLERAAWRFVKRIKKAENGN